MIFSELTDEELYDIDVNVLTKTDLNDLIKEKFKRKVNEFVRIIETDYKPITINEDKPELYLYIEGYYHPHREKMLLKMCNDEFQNANKPMLYKEILHKIKSYRLIDRTDFLEPNNKINLLNGVLNVYTKELELHNPDYYFLYKLNINY